MSRLWHRIRRLFGAARAASDDPVALCRDLRWHGFEHLHAAEAHDRGVLLVIQPQGDPTLARHALLAYLVPPPEPIDVSDVAGLTPSAGKRWLLAPSDPDAAIEAAKAIDLPVVGVVAEGRGGGVVEVRFANP